MVAGQYPTREWKPNPNGEVRTIEQAVQIAKRWGVEIPDEVQFYLDEAGELNKELTARGPRVDKYSGERVYWSDLVHPVTKKIPFRIWPDILKSDEAIVAVIAHEMHELNSLRPYLEDWSLSIDDYIAQTEPGRPHNYHDEAWDVGDNFVDKMRGGANP
jgi:hypothetical protein